MKHFLFIALLVSFVFSPNLTMARKVIKGNKITIKLPETINEKFIIQIYSQRQINDNSPRSIKLASEVIQEGIKDKIIEITPKFNKTYNFHLERMERSKIRYYLRIIKVDSLKYKVYSVTSFTPQSNNSVLFENLIIEDSPWNTINFSKGFTFEMREQNPQEDTDYSANLAAILGLPKSYYYPFESDSGSDWAYKVKGVYFINEGEDRYFIDYYKKKKSEILPDVGRAFTIDTLNRNNFQIVDESHYGD